MKANSCNYRKCQHLVHYHDEALFDDNGEDKMVMLMPAKKDMH